MKFGYFDDLNREYVITQPDTPLPWINYLGCQAYFGIISNTAGGYSFYRDARLRRLTRYRYNNVPLDFGGRYIYLRDDESKEFWSPSWQPTRHELKDYSCRHGMGYTVIGSEYAGIEAHTRYFVPLDENLEIWQLTVTNKRATKASISAFSSIEFCLWDAQDDATNFQRNFNTGQVEVEDGVIYHKTEYRERRDHFAYFACFRARRRIRYAARGLSWPLPRLGQARHRGSRPAHQLHRSRLVADRRASGQARTRAWRDAADRLRPRLPRESRRTRSSILPARRPSTKSWSSRPSPSISTPRTPMPPSSDCASTGIACSASSRSTTPDIHTNRMVNIWNAYQCMATFNMSRSASFYESGIGRGLGFRDSNQDLLGFVHMAPARARERILDLAATQLPTGGAYHQYQPLTKRGNNDIGGGFNDDPHWLIIGVSAYLKETGDWSILDEPVQYDNEPGSEQPLYEHLQRSFHYTLERLGPHGLPLDRARRLERLPQSELLLRHAGPELPDHHQQGRQGGRVGLHRRTLCPCRPRTGRHRQPSRAWGRGRPHISPKPPRWSR